MGVASTTHTNGPTHLNSVLVQAVKVEVQRFVLRSGPADAWVDAGLQHCLYDSRPETAVGECLAEEGDQRGPRSLGKDN